jgi:hypothetical protein
MRTWQNGVAAIVITAVMGCTGSASPGQAPNGAPPMAKLSQFDKAQYCDIAVGAAGSLHAVFTEESPSTQTTYLYYRASTDGGRTWSAVKNLSDDETTNDASYSRVMADAQGRVYVVWKYVGRGSLTDGPGGIAPGDLTVRVLEGGTWSPRMLLGDAKVPSFSWFAAKDAAGAVHIVWSQSPKDAALAAPNSGSDTAGLIRQVRMNGSSAPAPVDVIVPKPLLTAQEQATMTAAGHYPPREDTQPRQVGLINLRGYIDAAGKVHFVAEDPGNTMGPGPQVGHRVVLWNGSHMSFLHTYSLSGSPNTFNNPPSLIPDAQGQDHLFRMPEQAETASVRDYLVQNGALGDPTDVLGPSSPKGAIARWQVSSLPGGQIALTAAISEKGGFSQDDLELMVTIRDGQGHWSTPVSLTRNAASQAATRTSTGGGSSVGELVTYSPRFAAVILDADGHRCVLMVNSADTLLSVGNPVANGTGQVATAIGIPGRVDAPQVFFRRW